MVLVLMYALCWIVRCLASVQLGRSVEKGLHHYYYHQYTPKGGRPDVSDGTLLSGVSGLSFDYTFQSQSSLVFQSQSSLVFQHSPLALSVLSLFLQVIHSDILIPENYHIVVRDMSSLLLPYISVRLYAVVYFNCYSVHSLYIYMTE